MYCKILLVLALFYFGNTTFSQEIVSKNITKTFDLGANHKKVSIENKYGNISIIGWDHNKVEIKMDVSVLNTDKKKAEELLSNIKPIILQEQNLLSIVSSINYKNNTVNTLLSKYRNKTGQNTLKINYTIKLPKNASLEINNMFGDLVIDDWNGILKVILEYGNISINQDLTETYIEVKYGSLKTQGLTKSTLISKNSDITIPQAENIEITCSGSNFQMYQINNLSINSNKDIIVINNVNHIIGTFKFSNIVVKKLVSKINLTAAISDIKIDHISKINPEIFIDQTSSDIQLNIAGIGFSFNATLEQGLLRVPKSFYNIDNKLTNTLKRIRTITAKYGNTNASGKIKVIGKKGVITLHEQ